MDNDMKERLKQIAEYSDKHSCDEAAKNFNVSRHVVQNARKEFGYARDVASKSKAMKSAINAVKSGMSVAAASRKYKLNYAHLTVRAKKAMAGTDEDCRFYVTNKAAMHPAIKALRV